MIVDKQRVVVGMIDGLGMNYFNQSSIPAMKSMAAAGLFRSVKAVYPTVTNSNNVSICCGAWPKDHGITGNSYFDERTGEADYMESADFIHMPTIIERSAAKGKTSALLTCKNKTIRLLSKGATVAVAAESPAPGFVDRFGQPPDIYSREINYWLWRVAIDILRQRQDIQLLYVHTTDYPMHMWSPEDPHSEEHLSRLDGLIDEARHCAPDAAFLLTADHGMNYKKRCWDLVKACSERGVALRFALSAEKDRYVKHHRTFGGAAWVWLKSPADEARAVDCIMGLEGIEKVLTRAEAAKRFHLMPERIGDLAVFGDQDTVFGELNGAGEALEPTYRSHGSLHETDVPLVIHNADIKLPSPEHFAANLDVTRIPFAI
ncbi:MAG TPA: alkaline phosphatase family protein [Candidatus Binatia bacterium]|jgi:phosphonoacetate hydrolase